MAKAEEDSQVSIFALIKQPKIAIDIPPVDWQAMADVMSADQRQTLADELLAVSEKAARMGRYLDQRAKGKDHVASVKSQNKLARMIRHSVGYSMPSAADIDF